MACSRVNFTLLLPTQLIYFERDLLFRRSRTWRYVVWVGGSWRSNGRQRAIPQQLWEPQRIYVRLCPHSASALTSVNRACFVLQSRLQVSQVSVTICRHVLTNRVQSNTSNEIFRSTSRKMGHAVAQLVQALRYKRGGRGFDSRWCHWDFYWHNPSGRIVALGSTQPLTEMSTRNTTWG